MTDKETDKETKEQVSHFIWSCARKFKHASEKAALGRLARGLKVGVYSPSHKPYVCQYCQWWHIGRSKKVEVKEKEVIDGVPIKFVEDGHAYTQKPGSSRKYYALINEGWLPDAHYKGMMRKKLKEE